MTTKCQLVDVRKVKVLSQFHIKGIKDISFLIKGLAVALFTAARARTRAKREVTTFHNKSSGP
jgi:hypothetical protein